MTKDKAITELVRIWHSPHLDLILKARLGEVIETLKENNQSDSLVRDDAENCKESESKLDLISRQDAIEVLTETIAPPSVTLDTLVMRIDALPSAEAVPGEWIRVGHDIYECSLCHQNVMTRDIDCYAYCHRCGARMLGEGGDSE